MRINFYVGERREHVDTILSADPDDLEDDDMIQNEIDEWTKKHGYKAIKVRSYDDSYLAEYVTDVILEKVSDSDTMQ